MAATVEIVRVTGAYPGAYETIASNTVANAQDVHQETAGTSSNPIKIPSAGRSCSYWVNTALRMITDDGNTINNIKWYSDGDMGFGTAVACKVATIGSGCMGGYTQATGTIGSSGVQLSDTAYNHNGIGSFHLAPETPIDAAAYTSAGAQLIVSGTLTTPGWMSGFVVYQLEVGPSASAGTTAQKTFTWQYDEF